MGLWGARPSAVAVFGVPAGYIFPSIPSCDKAVFSDHGDSSCVVSKWDKWVCFSENAGNNTAQNLI
jgi:hypothetical protein